MSPTPESRPEPENRADDAADLRAMARSPAQAFWHGVVLSLPFLVVIIPFALLFGVVAMEAGMDVGQVMGFSVLVLAGASQFTAVQLITENASTIVIILSCLVVNLRMAMYSASLVPWLRGAGPGQKLWIAYTLIDQSYALSIQHFERHPRLLMAQRLAFFSGTAVTLCLPWMLASWAGATLGRAIPDDIALDFAMPITFIAMIAPMLRSTAHLVACFVAIVGSLLLAWMPSGLGLMIAAPIGMACGATVEWWYERKA